MGIPGVEGLERSLAGIREKVMPVPDKTRNFVGALKGYLEDSKRWETVWEWSVPIGSSRLTIIRIERFRFF